MAMQLQINEFVRYTLNPQYPTGGINMFKKLFKNALKIEKRLTMVFLDKQTSDLHVSILFLMPPMLQTSDI